MKYVAEVNRAVAQWGPRYGVSLDPALVHAVIERETRHGAAGLVGNEPDGDRSWGPMQVKGATARTVLGVADPSTLKDAATGIWHGTRYLASLLARFKGDVARAVAGYNAGPGNAVRRPDGTFRNQAYVAAVLGHWNTYRRVLGTAAPAAGLLVLVAVGAYLWTRRRRGRLAA